MADQFVGNERLLTTKEAAAYVGMTVSSICSAIRLNKLKAIKTPYGVNGRHSYLISEKDLQEWKNIYNPKSRKSTVDNSVDRTLETVAKELLKRMNLEYQRGFEAGKKQAKEEFMQAVKGVKV